MILRPRQQIFVDKSIDCLHKYNNTVSIAPTGAGKSVCLSALIKQCVALKPNIKVAVIAHRDELTYQNQNTFLKVAPNISTSIVNAEQKDWGGQVVFAMVQTLSREENLQLMPNIDLLVVDEAHHITADSYIKIIKQVITNNRSAKIFGLTATPTRGDKHNIGVVFTNCADQITLTELINSGHLVRPITYRIDTGETEEKLQALRVKATGDYSDQEMSEILNTIPLNKKVVEEWIKKAADRKTVVFCSDVAHAMNVTDTFKSFGINASLVTGAMAKEDRQKALNSLETGEIQVIVNVAILTEGWDYPPISCVILLRSSSYKSTMIQMIGRGLRTIDATIYPDTIKQDCIVLDFGISTILHGSLEQQINLNAKETGFKICPACKKPIPKGINTCPLCDADMEQVVVLQKEDEEKRILEDFVMAEINLLAQAYFKWTDLCLPNGAIIAAGFNSWCCVLRRLDEESNQEIWLAIGGSKQGVSNIPTTILFKGDKLVALARGEDFLNEHETQESASKLGQWRSEKPSKKQRQWLPREFKGNRKLTKGDASAILTYSMLAKNEIAYLLKTA